MRFWLDAILSGSAAGINWVQALNHQEVQKIVIDYGFDIFLLHLLMKGLLVSNNK